MGAYGGWFGFWRRLGTATACLGLWACGVGASDDVQKRSLRTAATADASGSAAEAPTVDPAAAAAELEAIVGARCPTRPGAPYGVRAVDVFAGSYGQSAGLYLNEGDSVRIEASGEWTIWENVSDSFGPAGHPELSEFGGCRKGSLVARLGLGLDAPRYCIGASGSFVAPRAGIVYLAMNDSGSPAYHGGQVTATVTSSGLPVPVVEAVAASDFAYCDVTSGWVELKAEAPLLLSVPTALADLHRDGITASLGRLSEIYQASRELAAGEVPYEGEPIRLIPDFSVRSRGWIVAANPLLYDPRMLNGVAPSRTKILRLGDPNGEAYEIARAIGVTFSRVRGARYQAGEAAAQAWGALFALHAAERVPIGTLPESVCEGREIQLEAGTVASWLLDPKLQTCLLMELTKAFGWDVHRRFFAALPSGDAWDAALPEDPSPAVAWAWVRARYLALAGLDAGLIFDRFRAP